MDVYFENKLCDLWIIPNHKIIILRDLCKIEPKNVEKQKSKEIYPYLTFKNLKSSTYQYNKINKIALLKNQ